MKVGSGHENHEVMATESLGCDTRQTNIVKRKQVNGNADGPCKTMLKVRLMICE